MSHPPLNMIGPKNGTAAMGIYTSDEIKDWIAGKLGLSGGALKARESSISSVVSDFTGGKGKPTSGPSTHDVNSKFHKSAPKAHTSMYRGNSVYHTSAGKAGAGGGTTIFYVNAQGNDGKIIGIGQHITSDSYKIEWNVPDWHVGKVLVLA